MRPLRFRHELHDPRLDLGPLAELAGTLPAAWIRAHPAETVLLREPGAPRLCFDGEPAEVVAGLDSPGGAARLYHLELTPDYRDLVANAHDEVDALFGDLEGGITERNGSAFLGSPGAITPCHPDRHHNLLLQVAGTKDLMIGTFDDPGTTQRETELTFVNFGDGPSRLPPNVETYDLGPGDGLYIPPYAFHWVRVGDAGASVALSIAWSTAATTRAAQVHEYNLRYRQRLGRGARPPGTSRVRDQAKAALIRARKAL